MTTEQWTALLHRAWLETRVRFVGAAVLFALLGTSTVFHARAAIHAWEWIHQGQHLPYARYVWLSLSQGYLLGLWIGAAILLATGGLVQEHEARSTGFTLGLPVSRGAVVATRAIVGAAEALGLALIPELTVTLLSPLVGYEYPIGQALRFGILLGGAGLVFYTLAFLLSHLIRREHTAPAIALTVAVVAYVASWLVDLRAADVFNVMVGGEQLAPETYLLRAGVPVASLSAWLAVAAMLVVLSVLVVSRRDF